MPGAVGLARRVNPDVLLSLDAIHLASAPLLDADLMLTCDVRPAEACRENGLAAVTPHDRRDGRGCGRVAERGLSSQTFGGLCEQA